MAKPGASSSLDQTAQIPQPTNGRNTLTIKDDRTGKHRERF